MGSDGWLYVYDREGFYEILTEYLGDKFDEDFIKQIENFSVPFGKDDIIVRYAEYGTDMPERDWLHVALEYAGLSCAYQGEGWKIIQRVDAAALIIERKMLWT